MVQRKVQQTQAALLVLLLALVGLGWFMGGGVRADEPVGATQQDPILDPPSLHAFLPLVQRGVSYPPHAPTLGPSPTPTPSPRATLGPSATPSPSPAPVTPTPTPLVWPTVTRTPQPQFEVLQAGTPDWVGPGGRVVFTIGALNRMAGPAQLHLENTLPAGMQLFRVWAVVTPTVSGNSFTLDMSVGAGRAENIFVAVTITEACNCYVTNAASWSATWNGGQGSGIAVSNPLYVTLWPSPTPTVRPTDVPPPSPTASPTATKQPTLGPSVTPTP